MAIAMEDVQPDFEEIGMEDDKSREVSRPVPRSSVAFLAARKLKAKRTLNDLVEDQHLKLVDDQTLFNDDGIEKTLGEKYAEYLDAVYDEQAIEGSIVADNIYAAGMIRDAAKRDSNLELGRQKVATIAKALNVVMRRYGQGRNERRWTVGGEVVSPTNNGE